MSELEVRRPKVPMSHASHLLADLCDRIDEGEDPGEALVKTFNETRIDLADAVDRRIAFDHWIEGAIEAASKARDRWAEQARKLKIAREAFKENTASIIEANPDLPYQGALGKLVVQRNGQPTLRLSFGEKELTPETIEFFGIDSKFIRETTKYSIDAAAVKSALQNGEEIDWAALEHKTHLRIKKS